MRQAGGIDREGKMPFREDVRKRFGWGEVQSLERGKKGVYGLYDSKRWIYVGRGDVADRLGKHLQGDNPCIVREKPTHFLVEYTRFTVAREKEFIAELKPVCNERIG